MRAVALGMGVAGTTLVATYLAPALSSLGPIRRLTPSLSGVGDPGHVALTFDDGPDPRSTPLFLRLLGESAVRATFFLLGASVQRSPTLARELVESGHEVAVHGWDHRCLAWSPPRATYESLARARDVIAEQTGYVPRWFRPTYGVLTLAAVRAAQRLDLATVLWTNWGRDWTSGATASSILTTLTRDLSGGAAVLLHDATAGHAAPGAWKATLEALPGLLAHCAENDLRVGELREHGTRLRHMFYTRSAEDSGNCSGASRGRGARGQLHRPSHDRLPMWRDRGDRGLAIENRSGRLPDLGRAYRPL